MVQNSPSLTVLKQYLKNCSKEELISNISELFKRFNSVKDYYQVKLSPQEETQIAAKYKKIIEDEFFPTRGLGKAKLSVAKKAITEYRKISETPVGTADIMLFYVEQGVKFINAYGDIHEPFYNSMESMYEKAVEWIIKYKIQDVFKERCTRIVKDTSGIGWGFHDTLSDISSGAFNNE
ncbi:MAG: hypothetical protein DCF20_15225 [Pseudanabaena sp.]|nr:MAG: hypothetical protein DCF20_15225 [Pseudanabaena sp.]